MEWFDFTVYGFLAPAVARNFFPHATPAVATLSTLAVFGIAFVMRPLGGVAFGILGDRSGRRVALVVPVLVMAAATSLMAALPNYAQIGVLAPVGLVLLRCLQGLSAGGAYLGAASFLVEYAPSERRGLFASVQAATGGLGVLLGAVTVLLLQAILGSRAFAAWGWRLPFTLGLPLGLSAIYLRLRVADTPVFRAMAQRRQVAPAPLRLALRRDKRAMATVGVCSAASGAGFYYLVTYVVNYLVSQRIHLPRSTALLVAAAGIGAFVILCPLAGLLTDRVGRRPAFLAGTVGLAATAIPAFVLMGQGIAGALGGVALIALFQALLSVTGAVLVVELFPASNRLAGGGLSYNVGIALVAGPAPLIAAALAEAVHIPGSAAFYLAGISALCSMVLAYRLPETRHNKLQAPVVLTLPRIK